MSNGIVREPSKTVPTVGRVVWYWLNEEDCSNEDVACEIEDVKQAFRADILVVHDDGRVNLAITDHFGTYMVDEDVNLFEPFDEMCHGLDVESSFATWMPYQAKKHAEDSGKTPAEIAMRSAQNSGIIPQSIQNPHED